MQSNMSASPVARCSTYNDSMITSKSIIC